jgi:hypothetical protein
MLCIPDFHFTFQRVAVYFLVIPKATQRAHGESITPSPPVIRHLRRG